MSLQSHSHHTHNPLHFQVIRVEQAKNGEASHTRIQTLVGVSPDLLRVCLELLENASIDMGECEDDCRRTWGEGSKQHAVYVQWNADYDKAVAELKAILGEK